MLYSYLVDANWTSHFYMRKKTKPTFPPFTSLAFQDLKIPFDSSGLEAIQLYEGPHSSMHQEKL